jgi:hypothetical protein
VPFSLYQVLICCKYVWRSNVKNRQQLFYQM